MIKKKKIYSPNIEIGNKHRMFEKMIRQPDVPIRFVLQLDLFFVRGSILKFIE